MSEILKAKNRIMGRSRNQSQFEEQRYGHQNQNNQQNFKQHQFRNQNVKVDPLYYPKKFNISSISMKFQKEQFTYQGSEQTKKRNPSPQFSRTQRINSIKLFQPLKIATLSQSNSQSSLRKISKDRNRRISNQRERQRQLQQIGPQQSEGRLSSMRNYRKTTGRYTDRDEVRTDQSPIQKIQKTVHHSSLNLMIVKLQNPRCQSPYKPRQCERSIVEKHLKASKQNNKGFIDDQFPPKNTIMFSKKLSYLEEGLSFQRLSKMYENQDKDIVLIKHCEPTFLRQGKFTNPYLYSALTILAQTPQRILSLFENQQVNQSGSYYVRICKDGVWRFVTVDDYVPIKVSLRNECLGIYTVQKSGIHQIWPSLIQKALAKVYGTYSDLSLSRQSGIYSIFKALTGLPVSQYDLIKDIRSYLVLIDSALKKKQYIILEDILPEFQQIAERKGLSFTQSYRILSIGKNCFVLRNLADIQLQTTLSFEQVMMFSSLLIFRQQSDFQYISQKLRHKKGYYSMLKVTIPKNTMCYWDIWQNNPAYYKKHLNSPVNYAVSPYKIILKPIIDSNSQSYRLSQYDSKPEQEIIVQSGKQISMKKGEYDVLIHLCQQTQRDFTVSYYGKENVSIERVKNSEKWQDSCCKQDY